MISPGTRTDAASPDCGWPICDSDSAINTLASQCDEGGRLPDTATAGFITGYRRQLNRDGHKIAHKLTSKLTPI